MDATLLGGIRLGRYAHTGANAGTPMVPIGPSLLGAHDNMTTSTLELLPGTEVHARGLRWEVVSSQSLGPQTAAVADAYGLSRDQYAHVLSTFSHASYTKAPELCLARFDELKQIGLEAFIRKHDPYWDIPLNENLPQPVIDLPIPGEAKGNDGGEFGLADRPKRAKGHKGK